MSTTDPAIGQMEGSNHKKVNQFRFFCQSITNIMKADTHNKKYNNTPTNHNQGSDDLKVKQLYVFLTKFNYVLITGWYPPQPVQQPYFYWPKRVQPNQGKPVCLHSGQYVKM